MTVFGGLAQSASLLLALVLAYSLITDRLPQDRWSTQLLQGLLFGGTALLGMLNPVTLSPGVLFDARTVVIAIAGLFGGPIPAVVSTLIAAAFRIWVGGTGALAGVVMILAAAGLGLGFRALSLRGKTEVNTWTLAAFGLVVHGVALASVLVLPAEIRAQIWAQVTLPYVTVLPAATLLLGLLLRMQELRRQDQLELRRGRERLLEAQRIASIGDWEWNLRTGRQDWSEQARLLYGRDPAFPPEPLPSTSAIYTDASWAKLTRALRELRQHGGSLSQHVEIRRPDGRPCCITLRAEAVEDRSGAIVGLRGTVADITETVLAAQSLRESQQKLLEAQYLARMGDFEWEIASGKVSWSDGLYRLLGYDPGEHIDFSTVNERIHHSEDLPRVTRWLQDAIDSGAEELPSNEYRLLRKDGGVIDVQVRGWIRRQDGEAKKIFGIVLDITRRKAHEAELAQIARYDHLTGAPNRRLLTDRLQQALNRSRRSNRIIALAYLDLDGFKAINDRHGHAVGDQVLINVTRTLREALRDEDTVARLGGDEFVLLVTDLSQPADCVPFLNRILAGIRTVNPGEGIIQGVSASIGVTLCPPDEPDPDTLLRHADQAMYAAKDAGKNHFQFYDAEQDRIVRARQSQREEIRRALENEELVLWFQPEVHLISGEVKRVEALVRWQHPERGLVLPGDFLPSIEATELEVTVGDWVLDTAMRRHLTWLRTGLNMPISINIGPNQLLRPDFVAKLVERFSHYPGSAGREFLELEILETAALSDLEQATLVVADCKALGLSIALDDFGTGYSSLAYLRRLAVDLIKIDQSFVRDMMRDPADLEIVETVIRLSSSLGRAVIAEGVETAGHAALLAWLGCRLGQGYGIARPMPAADLPGWLEQWSAQPFWPDNEPGPLDGHPEISALIAMQNHGRWLHRFHGAIARGDLDALATLRRERSAFSSWYLGLGAAAFGKLSEFRAVGAAHNQLHRLTDDLTSALRTSIDPAARTESATHIQVASRIFRRNLDRFRPPARMVAHFLAFGIFHLVAMHMKSFGLLLPGK